LREIDVVHLFYYTDPVCPWSWALEPALRKLEAEFGDGLSLTCVMCGMAREAGDTGHLAGESAEDALRRFGTMATPEVALVCDLPGPRAPADLWRLATEWRVRAERVGTGHLWSLA
jgi:hypothetical protein